MAGTSWIERRLSRLIAEAPTVRNAARAIVGITPIVVVGSGIVIRLVDHKEYSNVWVGMWWALQTVTTVGYGDVTPKDVAGRIGASVVLLEGVAFLAILTAAITSTFVARTEREQAQGEGRMAEEEAERIDARFDELAERLDRLESLLRGDDRR